MNKKLEEIIGAWNDTPSDIGPVPPERREVFIELRASFAETVEDMKIAIHVAELRIAEIDQLLSR